MGAVSLDTVCAQGDSRRKRVLNYWPVSARTPTDGIKERVWFCAYVHACCAERCVEAR